MLILEAAMMCVMRCVLDEYHRMVLKNRSAVTCDLKNMRSHLAQSSIAQCDEIPEKRSGRSAARASLPVTARAFPNFLASACKAKPPQPELRVSHPPHPDFHSIACCEEEHLYEILAACN